MVIDMMEAEVVSEVEARAGDDCVDCPLRGGFPCTHGIALDTFMQINFAAYEDIRAISL